MKLVKVPQKVYNYGDGVPAFKSGDWPGSKPSHWYSSKLILNPIMPDKDNRIPGGKHFPAPYSKEYQFRPCCRMVKSKTQNKDFFRRLIKLAPIYREPRIERKKAFLMPIDQIIEPRSICPLFQSKIRVEEVKPILNREYSVADIMTRKKRLETLEERRNRFLCRSPGEKNYKCVEYSPGFCKQEGLIVGSTNRFDDNRVKVSGGGYYATLDLKVSSLNPDKIYDIKTKKQILKNDVDYVSNLADWEKNILYYGKEEEKKK